MKKLGIILAVLVLLGTVSCAAGPQQLYRTVDDIDQKLYVDQPILDGVLYFIPVIPLAKYVATIGDFFIVNPYHFWLNDIWDGTGTGFEHLPVDAPDGRVKSLYIDDAQFLFAE
jgi:hypothetical protein